MDARLSNIETKEISFVDKPANKRRFLFFKSRNDRTLKKGSDIKKKLEKNINVVIDSDGTVGGTKISINGDEIKKLRDFSFSFWGADKSSSQNPVSCSYSRIVEAEDGFVTTETLYLAKGDKMDKEIVQLLKDYLGDKFKAEHFEKAEAPSKDTVKLVKSALKTLNKYGEDFPSDLEEAVGVLAKYACHGYGHLVVEKSDKSDANNKSTDSKSDDDVSKSVAEKIVEAVQKALLPETKKSESNKSEDSELKTSVAELTKAVQSLTEADNKDKEDSKISDVVKAVEKLAERIEVVEKSRGTKKSVDGQDDNSDDGDTKVKWPSLNVKSEDE